MRIHNFADPALSLLANATAPPGSAAHAAWLETACAPPAERLLEVARLHDLVLPMTAVLARAPSPRIRTIAAHFNGAAQALTFRALALAAELVRLNRRFDEAESL